MKVYVVMSYDKSCTSHLIHGIYSTHWQADERLETIKNHPEDTLRYSPFDLNIAIKEIELNTDIKNLYKCNSLQEIHISNDESLYSSLIS